MSELKGAKMEGSKVPAEEIKNPDLVAAIEKMQDDNTTENINKMIDEVMKAKFILPAKVTPKTEAKTTNGQTVMQQSTQKSFSVCLRTQTNFSSGKTLKMHRRLLQTLTVLPRW